MYIYLISDGGSYNNSFGPMINAGIHTVMYSFYGLTGLGFKLPAVKPFITSGQMAQFVVILAHAMFHVAMGGRFWRPHQIALQIGLMIQMLYMFGDFFRSAYLGGGKARPAKAAKSS
jgi:hypothetical protein